MQSHHLLYQPRANLSAAALNGRSPGSRHCETPSGRSRGQEGKQWREGARVVKKVKNPVSLAKSETGAQVVNITSNYLP